ncbi:restriction endonuclease subunit S [Lactobacillus delbrueckii subsp. bulgaricus]|uniref:restriction endonuclease subunit S n=1 Tax=Lactobacillus delbrueckii TaxID=1584 RepID=UPI001E5B8F77|nr:restriction endonuclease subunit S [Lactobacillus delbrueckii]MCD5462550.1 restriction endonuclease subunit S [Lactobacillus delbrueckii subsp. bulgaricus]MCD5478163.1 restriction endonuclease subunit S [Lactobacillus delbrueckii subsp. bulgaricus]
MKVRLGDVLELNPRESIVKNTIARKISMTDLKPFTRDIPTFSYEKYSGGAKFRNNDILLARITPCLENGKTALVNILDKDEVAFGSTEYFVLRAKKGLIDPYYLYYLSISQDFRNVVIKSMTGTSGRQRAQKDAILEYKLDLPNIQEQQSIAKQLRALDDKIRLNKQINDNLLETCKTNLHQLINEKEYEVTQIGSLDLIVSDHVANGSFKSLKNSVKYFDEPNFAIFLRNIDLKNRLDGNLKYIDETSYNFLKKSHLFGGEVVISNVADVGSVHRVPRLKHPMVVGNNQIFIRSKNQSMNDYLFIFFNSKWGQHAIHSITSGSAQQKFNKTDFKKLNIPIPTDNWVDNHISPFLKMTDLNKAETRLLKRIKSSLLNKYF